MQTSHQTPPALTYSKAGGFEEIFTKQLASFSLILTSFSPNEAIRKNFNGQTSLQDKKIYGEGDATSVCALLKARKTKKGLWFL